MSKEKVVLDETVAPALKAFQTGGDGSGNNNEEDSFLVLGYGAPSTLTVVATGAGGLEQARQHFIDEDARYCLIRKVHKVDVATTVKFVFIDWTPDTVKPMRKALLSTHKGQVQDTLKPYHVSFQMAQHNDVTEQDILSKISDSAGTSVHVTNKAESKYSVKLHQNKVGPALVPSSVKTEAVVLFEDEEAVRGAIRSIRDDNNESNWCLVGYKDVNTLTLLGQGSGGVEELMTKLNDDEILYALFRTTEVVDKSVTVKFGFLKLLSDKVKPMEKARIGTHMGFVQKLFSPFHVEWMLDTRADFSLDIVTQRFRENMFLDSRVRDNEAKAPIQRKSSTATSGPRVPMQGTTESLKFADEEAFRKTLADVRNDQSETNWLSVSYAGKHTLSLLGSGTGDVDEMLQTFEEDNVNFGLLRVIEVIDKSKTVKFVYLKWQPETVAPMKKAEISVKKGAIDDLFRPYHVDFFISTKQEINQQLVMDRVAAVSGSKSNVK